MILEQRLVASECVKAGGGLLMPGTSRMRAAKDATMAFGGLTETRTVVWLPAHLESAASERRQRKRWDCQELDCLVMRCGEMRKWLMGAKEGAQGLGSERRSCYCA